jgi:hypothetical protein
MLESTLYGISALGPHISPWYSQTSGLHVYGATRADLPCYMNFSMCYYLYRLVCSDVRFQCDVIDLHFLQAAAIGM